MGYVTLVFLALVVGLVTGKAAPGGGGFIAAAASTNVKPPVVFDGGNVGVNFGGYSASAGLGGLLTGGSAQGGLHAEAGTPFGHSAGAGLGGVVAGGKSVGGLYAGAESGVGAAAAAGMVGSGSATASFGGSVASAASGEAYVTKVVEHHASPVVIEKTVQGAPTVQRTIIEKTVIPNYVEKTIQVPSYVEKTVRVPTVVEKTVRVPAAPTVIEKTVDVPVEHRAVAVNTGVAVGTEVHSLDTVKVIERPRPVYHKHWVGGFGGGYNPGFLGGLFAKVGIGGGAAVDAGSISGGSVGGGSTYSYGKTVDSRVVNDIFNIPISTLGAVNRLVGGIVGGAGGGGSFSVSKHYSAF